MSLKFNFRVEKSSLLGVIHRPVVQAFFWSAMEENWTEVWLIVDTGADYTLLPRFMSQALKVDLEKECKIFNTLGVGGSQRVYLLPKMRVRLGKWERQIPVGFLDSDEIPPLMGRKSFFETFETRFSKNHTVEFKG